LSTYISAYFIAVQKEEKMPVKQVHWYREW